MSSMRDYGLAVPHGPNMGGEHVATANIGDMSANESGVFASLLKPDDIYDENGTYWADLPFFKRAAFVRKVDSAEAKKELRSIGSMMKKDPLSPVGFYARNMIIPGAGLLLEGYDAIFPRQFILVLTMPPVTFCFPSETSSLFCRQLSPSAGAPGNTAQPQACNATRPGSKLSTISRFAVSSLVRFLLVSLVIGSDVAGVSSRML